ncbi:MAG: DegT/DnrJ/EryC1/StrS family aminotransferase [Deltaproteobacteria bacterium]|nr:DegT/DnrJ/EryC1/StrS family aminotransferase [Deltaproteobacteria bacterium]
MSTERDLIRLAHPTVDEAVLDDIRRILESGRLTQGEYVERFEAALCDYFGCAHAVTLNSGTMALYATLRELDVGPGDNVIVPDYGFVATANAVALTGARVVFADVDGVRGNIDLSGVEAVSGNVDGPVKAVVAVHQFGWPASVAEIGAWAKENGAILIEDSACAVGTTVDGRAVGGASGIGVLSFHPRKMVTTGEGGALLTDDADLAARVRSLSNHGFDGAREVAFPGMNLRLPEIAAALGLAHLADLGERIDRRRAVGDVYRDRLAKIGPLRCPVEGPGVRWNHQTFAVVLPSDVDRQGIIERLAAAGIQANIPGRSLSLLGPYRVEEGESPGNPATSRVWDRRAVGLPCHEKMTVKDAEYICDVLTELLI